MTTARRSLNVVGCKVTYTGQSKKTGKEFSIYEVMATKPDGSPVELELRSFDNLPLGVGEFEVEKRVDPKYGDTYMLKVPGPRGPQANPLEQRVSALEQQVALLTQRLDARQPDPLPNAGTSAYEGAQF